MTDFLAFIAGSFLWTLQAAAPRTPEPQDPDRPRVSIRDFKGLQNNIFSPARAPRPVVSRTEKPRESAPSAPSASPGRARPPLVTGFIFDDMSQAYQVLVEDRNADLKLKLFTQPRFLRAGEEFLGYMIESVDLGVVSVRVGEEVGELRVGESFPEIARRAPEGTGSTAAPSSAVPPAGAPPAGKAEPAPAAKTVAAPLLDEAMRSKILEERKSKFKKKRDESDFEEP